MGAGECALSAVFLVVEIGPQVVVVVLVIRHDARALLARLRDQPHHNTPLLKSLSNPDLITQITDSETVIA